MPARDAPSDGMPSHVHVLARDALRELPSREEIDDPAGIESSGAVRI